MSSSCDVREWGEWGELPAFATRAETLASAVEEGRRAGYDDGYRAGVEAGRAEAARLHNEFAVDAAAVLLALRDAAASVRAAHVQTAAEVESLIVSAALDLAEAIVGREVAVSASPGADALARVMRVAGEERPMVVRLHPDDVAMMPSPPAGVVIMADPHVERGGAIAEAGDWRVDAQLVPALDRARAALLGPISRAGRGFPVQEPGGRV